MSELNIEDLKDNHEKRIAYHLKAYKELPPSFIRAGVRIILIKIMNDYNKLVGRIAFHCSSWW